MLRNIGLYATDDDEDASPRRPGDSLSFSNKIGKSNSSASSSYRGEVASFSGARMDMGDGTYKLQCIIM